MDVAIVFIVAGYLSGSILFTNVFLKLTHRSGALEKSADHNPGVFNAFKFGGKACGIFALVGDFAKAFIPVVLYLHVFGESLVVFERLQLDPFFCLVLAAPVVGHAFPVFYRFKGGKGITASFGALAALLPEWQPVVFLACIFLLCTVVFDIKPNYWKTFVVYVLLLASAFFMGVPWPTVCGIVAICAVVMARLLLSHESERKQAPEVIPVWKRW